LSDEEAVKGVTVMERQLGDPRCVSQRDWKGRQRIIAKPVFDKRKYFIKSSGRSSKSAAMRTSPFASPSRRWLLAGATGTKRTTGLLARAMTISSPASTRAISD